MPTRRAISAVSGFRVLCRFPGQAIRWIPHEASPLLVAVAASSLAGAQSVPPPAGGPYVMAKDAIAAGGQRAIGGSYVLTGTVAQAAPGPLPAAAAGGTYHLAGGFHIALAPPAGDIFHDGFEN